MNQKKFEQSYMNFLLFDKPIPYKDLLIYPAIMDDFYIFNICIESLVIDKNTIPDINIIKMSYLDYLYYDFIVNKSNMFYEMLNLLHVVFKVSLNDIEYGFIQNKQFILSIKQNDKDIIINKNDFDEIRKIICYQNLIEFPDDNYIPPDLKKALEEAKRFKNKTNKKMGSLEDQIICLMISTSLDLEYINKMSIRKFEKALSRVDYKLQYSAMLNGEFSGMVSFKKEPDHWMCDLTVDDKYADVKVDLDDFKKKNNFDNQNTVQDISLTDNG